MMFTGLCKLSFPLVLCFLGFFIFYIFSFFISFLMTHDIFLLVVEESGISLDSLLERKKAQRQTRKEKEEKG